VTDSPIRASAGLVRCTWLARIELQGFAVAGDLTPPVGCRIWRLARTRALLTGKPPIHCAFPQSAVYTIDVTSVYADFLLIGPRARDILSKLTSLNVSDRALPDGASGQTSLAHTHCIVLRDDRGGVPAFHLLVARDYGQYVWEALLHAGEEYHLTPVEPSALEAL